MKLTCKSCQRLIALIIICFVSCETETENNKANQTGNLSKSSFLWMYRFDSDFEYVSAISQLKQLNIANVFLAINTKQLQPSGPSAGDRYTDNFKAFLDMAKAESINIHLNILYLSEFTYEENHQQGLDRISYLVDFLNENPAYKNHPIQGIHIDIEPYALDEWDNTTDWDVKNNLMGQYLTFLEKAYGYIKGASSFDDGKLPWITISVAIAEHLDSKFRDGLLPHGDTELIKKYADFAVPMVYFSSNSASKYSLEEKAEMIFNLSKDEVNTLPCAIGINVSNFDSFSDIQLLEKNISSSFSGNENFLGLSFFKFESLFSKFEQ